jgi:ABC-type Fe3+/spermidine/putrescine transport system ATPase subunit
MLNLIAGFLYPNSGRVSIFGRDVTNTPSHRRGLGMVFQNHALFPHMTVYDNVAYGLKRQKLPKNEVEEMVARVLETVRLAHTSKRRPTELSGGEQQRIGLARALAVRPKLFLLDEPLSSLDADLRRQMVKEIRNLHERFELTTIYVTHDQDEAMVLGDRIAVMQNGRLSQLGAPREIYERPSNGFVTRFIGRRNILTATVSGEQRDSLVLTLSNPTSEQLTVARSRSAGDISVGDAVEVSILEERVVLSRARENGRAEIAGTVHDLTYHGARSHAVVDTDYGLIRAQLAATDAGAGSMTRGQRVWVGLCEEALWLTAQREDG